MKINSPWALRLGIVLLVALEFLQNGMLAFGANHIIQGLNSTPQAFSLAAAVYASVAILLIVKHRWLVDRLGYRDFVLGSLVLYILGALGAGFAQDMALFTLARAVQALGGATFFTAARMQVNRFPAPERLLSIRFFVTGLFLGSIIAPILAAWLLSVAVGCGLALAVLDHSDSRLCKRNHGDLGFAARANDFPQAQRSSFAGVGGTGCGHFPAAILPGTFALRGFSASRAPALAGRLGGDWCGRLYPA